jgi:hypothetical protein
MRKQLFEGIIERSSRLIAAEQAKRAPDSVLSAKIGAQSAVEAANIRAKSQEKSAKINSSAALIAAGITAFYTVYLSDKEKKLNQTSKELSNKELELRSKEQESIGWENMARKLHVQLTEAEDTMKSSMSNIMYANYLKLKETREVIYDNEFFNPSTNNLDSDNSSSHNNGVLKRI